jgi:hypothetical protein
MSVHSLNAPAVKSVLTLWKRSVMMPLGHYNRLVAGRSYRAALVIAQLQETHFAIREAIDLAILEERARAYDALEGAQRASAEGPAPSPR